MKVPNMTKTKTAKTQMLSCRMTDQLAKDIETVRKILQKRRGPGANEVSKTEVVQILMELGTQKFLAENK